MSWLLITVQRCAGFLQHECVLALIQYVCTGYGFPQYRYVFHSSGYGLPQHICVLAVFTVCMCTGYVLPQHMCVLAVFTLHGCTGYVLPQHVRVLAVFTVCVCIGYVFPQHVCVCWQFLHYMGVLVTVLQENLVGGKFSEIGESSLIHQTKTIQISTYN